MSPSRHRSNSWDTSETCETLRLKGEKQHCYNKTVSRPLPLDGNQTNPQPPITARLCRTSINRQTFSGTSVAKGHSSSVDAHQVTSTLNRRLTVFIAPFLIGQCTLHPTPYTPHYLPSVNPRHAIPCCRPCAPSPLPSSPISISPASCETVFVMPSLS